MKTYNDINMSISLDKIQRCILQVPVGFETQLKALPTFDRPIVADRGSNINFHIYILLWYTQATSVSIFTSTFKTHLTEIIFLIGNMKFFPVLVFLVAADLSGE